MKNVLNTPVPNVLAYNPNANNPVGAEYIIMEKVKGVPLRDLWDGFRESDKMGVVEDLLSRMRKWERDSFSMLGGLYYRRDVGDAAPGVGSPMDQRAADGNGFAMGPSTGIMNNENGRMDVEFDRGPCV